jgi:integrase
MFVYLTSNGWGRFVEKYRSAEAKVAPSLIKSGKSAGGLTVGEYLAAAKAESDLAPKTFKAYASRFRFIVSQIFEINDAAGRHDYAQGGNAAWIEKIDRIPLSEVTSDRIRAWKRSYVDQAGRNEVLRRQRTNSVNSTIRQARSAFSKRHVLSKIRSIQLPAVLPFDDVPLDPRTDTKFYGSGADPLALMRAAIVELGEEGLREELKAFLLTLAMGLRRLEVDHLQWASFDFDNATLRIVPTEHYALKTNESAAELPVEPQILELFRGWRAQATGAFVLESDRPVKSVDYQYYRCEETFQSLLKWLRSKGVKSLHPIHAMRKEYGSALADLHGLHAASSGLRHSDIAVTSSFYADRRVKVTPGFGSAISGASAVDVSAFPVPQAKARKSAL